MKNVKGERSMDAIDKKESAADGKEESTQTALTAADCKEASTQTTLTAADKMRLARDGDRPSSREYIEYLFDDFFYLAGDRLHGEDAAIIGGIGFFSGIPVTVIGHQKGRSLEENMKYRFGMPGPEGYRKAARLMRQAEKFHRPVITFIDTPGAYPGTEAEAGGQGEAIARSIALMSRLKTPVISVFIGEGGSGGALALGVADRVIMLENSVFSILSPEGFASILWKDSSRWKEACDVMKITAQDLKAFGICDKLLKEPEGGAQKDRQYVFKAVRRELENSLEELTKESGTRLAEKRYKRLRDIGKNMNRRKAETV